MRLRRKRRQDDLFAEINIVPFTDVVLVLLIIFMITANFIATGTGMTIELPSAQSAAPQAQSQTVVFITADGQMYLNSTKVDADGLQSRLLQAAASDAELVVIVSADRNVPYSRVASALDAVRGAGVRYLALAAELPKEDTP